MEVAPHSPVRWTGVRTNGRCMRGGGASPADGREQLSEQRLRTLPRRCVALLVVLSPALRRGGASGSCSEHCVNAVGTLLGTLRRRRELPRLSPLLVVFLIERSDNEAL